MAGRAGRARRHGSAGQETLQTILVVAFVLMPVLVAIFTFGSLIHLSRGEQAAAARGARVAGVDGGFGQPEYNTVIDALNTNGVDAATCNVNGDRPRASLGEPITVTVSCPQKVSIPFLFQTQFAVTSTFVSRGEVNQ